MKQIKIIGTKKNIQQQIQEKLSSLPEDKKLQVTIGDVKRTNKQNRALHLYFSMLAVKLNDANLFYTSDILKSMYGSEYQAKWTSDMIKEILWRPTQITLTGKVSSTELTTGEFTVVLEALQQGLANVKITIGLPSIEGLEIDNLSK